MEKFFGKEWRTNIVGLMWIGYGTADFYLHDGLSEFGLVALVTGLGFWSAKDKGEKEGGTKS